MEDRYEILDVVARGAMATVWRARDVRLGRVVAIKRPHGPDAGSTDSFVAAARSAAAVTHPNLVTIFDTGTDATGAYLVMEFVDGPSLAEMGGTTDGAATLGTAIASGLAALHAAGIVHRDVRPSNILLGPTGPKLTNFGTARTLDTGDRSGTARPRFEAPEVLAGSEPTQAADVYSLGAVLSWLVGQSSPDPALSAAIDPARSDEPGARPTAATLAERLHEIAPAPIAAVTSPVMAASPDDDATRQFDGAPLSSEATDTEPSSPSRKRILAALTALVVVALIAAIVVFGGDDRDIPVAGDTTVADTVTTTTGAPSAGTEAPATTEAEESGGVFNTVRVFVTFIRETPGEVLERTDAEEIISNIADGVSEAIRGNDAEAEANFEDAVKTVESEVESETVVDRAIELITRLARQLGLDVEGAEPSG